MPHEIEAGFEAPPEFLHRDTKWRSRRVRGLQVMDGEEVASGANPSLRGFHIVRASPWRDRAKQCVLEQPVEGPRRIVDVTSL